MVERRAAIPLLFISPDHQFKNLSFVAQNIHGMPVNGHEYLLDSIQCRAGVSQVSLDRFTENHQIPVRTCLDNSLFGGKEFVNVCRRHAQFLGDIRDRGFFEPELTKQLVGFDHDPSMGFIASETFAGKLTGSDRSDENHYSSLSTRGPAENSIWAVKPRSPCSAVPAIRLSGQLPWQRGTHHR